MRFAAGFGLVGACCLMTGCAWFHHHPKAQPATYNGAPPIVTTRAPEAPPPQPSVNQPAINQTPTAPTPTLTAPVTPEPPPKKPVIKADLPAWGDVVKINSAARFVIVAFEAGTVPPVGQQFNVYRAGTKVGEIRITGPQQENDTVADIVSGDLQLHDEARAQ
jgi:hypothetical protein